MLFKERGLMRRVYELQTERLSILEELTKVPLDRVATEQREEELAQLRESIALLATQADQNRLTESRAPLPSEEFIRQEERRRGLFFRGENPFQVLPIQSKAVLAQPLDEVALARGGGYLLYTEKFYRFAIAPPLSALHIQVYEGERVVGEERVSLPNQNSPSWKEYLSNGMVVIPQGELKEKFGLELRLHYNPHPPFSLVITQRAHSSRYHYYISCDRGKSLYRCSFIEPPPWQLGLLSTRVGKGVESAALKGSALPPNIERGKEREEQITPIPLLDAFVKELAREPIALAGYVQNEIAFFEPFLYRENGIFQDPGVHRSLYKTFVEKRGSPSEQCNLLLYLLRKAGYTALCVEGGRSTLPHSLFKKMAHLSLDTDPIVQYPWVLLLYQGEWISLFPWVKEIEIEEGEELYHHLPEEYGSADRWIRHYLERDEKIVKYIGPDEDDTVGTLFPLFVEGELRKRGCSLLDIGRHSRLKKRQFLSWKDFPRPTTKKEGRLHPRYLLHRNALVTIELFSPHHTSKRVVYKQSLIDMGSSFLQFTTTEEGFSVQYGEGESFFLAVPDQLNITLTYKVPLGSITAHTTKTLSLPKGEDGVLCFHLGGSNPALLTQLYQQLSKEKEPKKVIHPLLALAGATYFERCSRQEALLAALHKVHPATPFAFGLVTLSAHPKMDMWWINPQQLQEYKQPISTNYRQFITLHAVNTSSNEHQILRDIFKEPHPISTCKLLQRAYREEGKFLSPTPKMIEQLPPECKNILDPTDPYHGWSYIYLTDPTRSQRGALIIHPQIQYTLISHDNRWIHGGGYDQGALSPDTLSLFDPLALRLHFLNSYRKTPDFWPDFLEQQPSFNPRSFCPPSSFLSPIPDVRLGHKSLWRGVADPVDVVTGALYNDEVDLILGALSPSY